MSRTHEIQIAGPAVRADRADGPMVRDLLDVLVEGSQGAARFALEGRSTASGPTPWWARDARHFALLTSPRADVIRVEALTLREIDPDRFHQGDLFKDFDPDRSAIDLFEEGLADAITGVADSDHFDDGLVKTYENLEALFRDGAESVEFINGRRLKVEQNGVEQVKRLRRQTPPDQATRTAGKLDAIRHSDRQFTLMLSSGESQTTSGASRSSSAARLPFRGARCSSPRARLSASRPNASSWPLRSTCGSLVVRRLHTHETSICASFVVSKDRAAASMRSSGSGRVMRATKSSLARSQRCDCFARRADHARHLRRPAPRPSQRAWQEDRK